MTTEFARGAGFLGQGVRACVRTPRLLALGLVPVVLTAVLFLAALVALLFFLGDLAGAATWFAADWPETVRTLTRVLAAVAILGLAFLVGVVSFTAVALAIGDPVYERISQRVEQWCGGLSDEAEVGFWRAFGYGLADSARLLAVAAVVGVVLFFAGFLPGVGQTVVPVLGLAAGGWFVALELVGIPFSRRGLRLRDRWRALRGHWPTALGFGTAVFACFLVPGGAVLVMPAAVVGGTLLARRVLDLPASPTPPGSRNAGDLGVSGAPGNPKVPGIA